MIHEHYPAAAHYGIGEPPQDVEVCDCLWWRVIGPDSDKVWRAP